MDFQKEIVSQKLSITGLRTILVHTDFSEYSDMALQEAIGISKYQDARIYLLHVRRLSEKIGVNSPEVMIRMQINKFPEAKSVEIVPNVRHGSPYKEILREQAERKIELIIIASRAKAGPLRLRTNKNLAARIIKKSPCSILVIGAYMCDAALAHRATARADTFEIAPMRRRWSRRRFLNSY
jgi:nucleotide-binding universal stress UspA family protein